MENVEEKKKFIKNFMWNVLGTGLNSFNSLFFLIIVTRINGINDAGIFSIGVAIAFLMMTWQLVVICIQEGFVK